MRDAESLKPGDLIGRYRLLRELGRGAMGMVFLAQDSVLNQQVCLKMLHASLVDHAEANARFTREIVLARRVAHHGVCRVYDLHDEDGLRFLSMEYIEGAPLRELVGKDAEALSIERVVRITRNICRGLAAAHDVGVIHRDLKPRNVMVRSARTATEPDDVCLLDFGIAAAEDTVALALTLPGFTLGTRHYIAPEVWAGLPATNRSDLFAVGIILYNLLVGRMPWPATMAGGEFLERMNAQPPPRPSTLRRDVPGDVDALVAQALAIDPARRFADAHVFAHACDDILVRLQALSSASELDPFSQQATTVDLPTMFAFEPLAPAPAPPSLPSSHSASPPPMDFDAPTRKLDDDMEPLVGPHIDDIGDDSASWVVGGRAVDLPARPKRMPTSVDSETAIVQRVISKDTLPKPVSTRRWRPAALGVLALGVIGIAIALVVVRPAQVPTTVEALPAEPTPPPEPAPPPEPTPPPAPAPEAVPTPEPAPEALPTPEPAPEALPQPEPEPEAGTEAANATRTGKVDAQQALRAVQGGMATKGLVTGDDVIIDRLLSSGARDLKRKHYVGAVDAADAAIARMAEVRIDRPLVENKLTRFTRLVAKVRNKDLRPRLDDLAGQASVDFAAGQYDAANRTLNLGFALLSKDR